MLFADATVHVNNLTANDGQLKTRAGRRKIIEFEGATVEELIKVHGIAVYQLTALVNSGRLRLMGGTKPYVGKEHNRDCMTCGERFYSSHRFHRICDKCKRYW